jgi:hypothetical protein
VIAALCCMGYGATPSSAWNAVETGVIAQHGHIACEHAGMLSHDVDAKVSEGSALTLCVSGV